MSNPTAYQPASKEEAEFLASYDASAYPRTDVTVDIVLLTIRDGDLCVLLVRRGDYPYKGHWALPGGYLEPTESLDEAAHRELAEETGLTQPAGHLEQLGTYGDPGRDPRGRVVSVAYLGLLPHLDAPQHGSDADDARFWRVDDIKAEGLQLAFDHDRILADGLERAASKLEYSPLATAFCRETFTLGELQRVVEAVWGTELDTSNFRRWALSRPGFVVPTGDRTSGRDRRGQLYTAGPATLLHPPMLRPAKRAEVADAAADTPGD